jgi:hypothetical protein
VLTWNTPEDLDLSVKYIPTGEIVWSSKVVSASGGYKNQDDGIGGMFLAGATGQETITWPTYPGPGVYRMVVYNQRVNINSAGNVCTTSNPIVTISWYLGTTQIGTSTFQLGSEIVYIDPTITV